MRISDWSSDVCSSDSRGSGTGLLPYLLVVGAPVGSLLLGLKLFPAGRIHAQPAFRLAQVGRWRKVDCLKAREMSQFGLYGVMASLLVGIALNVPVRTLEFLGSIPALGSYSPPWFVGLYRSEEHTSELQSLMR